ncbi:site-specific integrase [Nitrospirales bacterium NOB]|nr:MAG: phage integrase family protein [Nitrospira sp. OLB3]MDL1888547.1 site-specific integrase [Nitrospirales bacterium NOB]
MTVEELTQKYLHTHLIGRTSFHCTRRRLRQLFDPIRSVRLNDLTALQVLQWHQDMRDRPHHANRALGILRAAIRWGVPFGLVRSDPTIGVKRHRVESRSRFLTETEVRQILEGLKGHRKQFAAYVVFLLLTGCRRGEARVTRWEHVDLVGRRWVKQKTKNGKWHVVPLAEQLTKTLSELPKCSPWIFPGQNGKPWSNSTIEKNWGKFRKRIELNDVRLHDLRRTAASHMVINGENLSIVQQMLDHASLQPTAIYARLNVAPLARALQANADRFFREVNL